MKTCVIYANCQGEIIEKILLGWPAFGSVFTTAYIPNYRYMGEMIELPRDLLARADLLIYQPIDKKREKYCTCPGYPNGIMSALKEGCTKIAFPYVYNHSPFIMFEEGTNINNKDVIIKLRESGKSLDEILRMFTNIEIDFRVPERFSESMEILREKEKDCNLIVSDFIEENIRERKMFYTQNHISNHFLYYIVNKMLTMLDMPNIPESAYGDEKMSRFRWPMSPYDISFFKYKYTSTPDPDWVSVYSNLITRTFTGNFSRNRDLYAFNLLQF